MMTTTPKAAYFVTINMPMFVLKLYYITSFVHINSMQISKRNYQD